MAYHEHAHQAKHNTGHNQSKQMIQTISSDVDHIACDPPIQVGIRLNRMIRGARVKHSPFGIFT